MAKVTLKDVADASGVSITTASFVMTGKGRISPEIRQKVLDSKEAIIAVEPETAAGDDSDE